MPPTSASSILPWLPTSWWPHGSSQEKKDKDDEKRVEENWGKGRRLGGRARHPQKAREEKMAAKVNMWRFLGFYAIRV